MSEELQNKKLGQIFVWFDQNADGWLTEDDFEKSAQAFTALATDGDEQNKSIMREGMFKWWGLLKDSLEDKSADRMGKEEYVRNMKVIMQHPTNFHSTVSYIADGMLKALDTNKDGVLSLEEYVQVYSRLGVTDQRLGMASNGSEHAFRKIDRDSDGQITFDELQQAIMEYFTSGDPDAPGQWLLGPPHELK